ncbi:uncharacterized protein LOC143149240 isoform X2 [Ptiloglossa arizonensis]|uniref:uncharacterized protein LOC143149240 isoform X2 n=1 Tax=Ptiloglossa arizonensis TaxID=3350558 RepID=UPI003FA1743A
MNYSGNMPDWHQFNASQTNEVTPTTQNVNSGHLTFIPGVSPPTLNALSLSSEGLNKHHTESNFNSRNFQSYNNVSSGPNLSNNSPLASMVQMQNCIGHYGSPNTRNPMLDNLNASVDPRNTTIGTINDEIGYRNNQVPFNRPIGHLSGPSCNLNASTGPAPGSGTRTNSGPGPGTNLVNGSGPGPIFGPGPRHGPLPGSGSGPGSGPGNMGPRNTNIGSVPPGKSGPSSFMSCKGLCCNSDPNINYQQWEKFGSYQNNTSYRDNVHPSGYQIENRHFGNNCNFRKDNLEGKETMGSVLSNATAVDHRRNFADYKYHKDQLTHRNYSTSSGMFHNYPMQNYNYSTEHQKYPYPVKEHPKTNNMNMSNSGMLKHQEQNFIAQQKFNNKQFQYQNGSMLPKGVPTLNVNGNMTSSQNPYFSSQYTRNIPTEISHECQETTDNATVINRMPGTYMHNSSAQQQAYQHKIAMQKFSMENHLRELSRVPGYQSHPKYKECILRYREILKLQQLTGYQNPVQQTSRVATPVNTAVPPINLQFDQNGILINSNFLADGFSKLQHPPSTEQSSENMEKQKKDLAVAITNEKCQQAQQSGQLMIPSQSEHVPSSCAENFQKQSQFSIHKDFNQNQLKVQTSERHRFDTLNTTNADNKTMQQKASKQFANKPDLDVRQFLANWDETDDEEGPTSNLQDTVLSETTPVVVVSYENVDLSSKIPQNIEASRRNSFDSSETTIDNKKEADENMITTQDCLTISYSPSESTEIAKTTKRTIEEGVVKPGSIIHCISNGPDEIPTIHIVDNLEISNILGASNDQVIQTLEKQKTFFRETTNIETKAIALKNTEQQEKNETCALSTNYNTSLGNVNKNTNIQDSRISETIQTDTASINNQELRVLSGTGKSNLDVTDNLDLKKQNSFASEESHNPDDISLPDLPTSECTPISTTLNTPIHSDSEESSQNIEDLSISTNPIEVMQNSPVISFTQSPVKMEPYGQLSSGDKLKNRSLNTLELEFQKENHYKNSDTTSSHEQEITLSNFDFSESNSKTKSAEIVKDKQVKCLGTNLVRKKVFLIDGNENDRRVSDTRAALTSIAYKLEVQQEAVESEKNSECESPNSEQEGKHKGTRRSTDSMKSVIQSSDSTADVDNIVHTAISTASNANLTSLTESGDETQASKHEKELSRRQKIKNLNMSINTINPTLSKVDLNTRKKIKESVGWEDKCVDRNADKLITTKKRDVEHVTQSKHSDIKRFTGDDSKSSRGEEHSVCHMTSQYKNYSVTVIKDNVILSHQKSHGTTEKNINVYCEKSPEFQLRETNTKELSEEVELKKHISSKLIPTLPENVHSQNSKKSELQHKNLETIDGNVRFTTDEIRLLNEYRREKDKLQQDKNIEEKLQKVDDNTIYHKNDKMECSQVKQNNELLTVHKVSLKQNVSSLVNLSPENVETPEKVDINKHMYSKNFVKNVNSDFGIQVANVNFKIKDSELGKEMVLRDNSQEHVKDSLDGIKIEINFSRTERNSKEQKQNKRLYENFRAADDQNTYEIEDSFSYPVVACSNNVLDCQHRLHSKEQETVNNLNIFDREANNTESNAATSVADTNVSTTLKNSGKNSLKANEDALISIISKGSCNLTSESQGFNKLLHNNVQCKDTSKSEIIEGTNYSLDTDMNKSKCAIPNTAIVDANNILIKAKNIFEEEDSSMHAKDDHIAKIQKENSSLVETSSQIAIEALKKTEEKEIASVSHVKNVKKLPELNLVKLSAKSLNSLSTLNFSFDKLDYKKCSGVNFDHLHACVNEVGELDETYMGKWKKPKINPIFEDCDMFQSTSGYINPIFSSIDKLEDLHTVPVYTTKDGKISYSPNRRFTHHELMLETRKRDGCPSTRKSHYTDTWNSYYNSKFRKLYKKKRHHNFSDKKKHEFKNMKCLYERKKNYSDDFCGRNHVKYKNYIHSIKNNNAVVSKIYSSSDSDEEIIDHNKYRITETSNHKKNHNIQNKATIITLNSHKSESVTDDLDLENKDKESTTSDVHSCKEAHTSVILHSNYGNTDENIKPDLNESPLIKSNDFTSESLQLSKDKISNNKCTSPSPSVIGNSNVFGNHGEAINTTDKLSDSRFLEEVTLLNENEQIASSYSVEGKENDKIHVSKNAVHIKEQKKENNLEILDNQTSFLETKDIFENINHAETNEILETNQIRKFNQVNFTETNEFLELHPDVDNIIQQKSEASLEPEELKNTPIEMIEILVSKKDISKTNDEKFVNSAKNISDCEQESNRIIKKVLTLNEESTNKNTKENIKLLKYENNDSLRNSSEVTVDTCVNQEEFESQIVQKDITPDQQNSEYISVEVLENDKKVNMNSDQIDIGMVEKYDELIFANLSKNTIHIENDSIIEDSIVFHGDEAAMEVLPNIKETSIDYSVLSPDNLIKHLHVNAPNNLQSEHESNLSQDSSVESKIPLSSMYCTIKDSSAKSTHCSKNLTVENEQEEKQCQLSSLESYSSGHSSKNNVDIKVIPKLVIKKTDTLSSKSECSFDYTESENLTNRYDAKLLTDVRQKIPKMIIMKSRSRSITPTVEILDRPKSERIQNLFSEPNDTSMDMDNSDSELYTLKCTNFASKVPKVKIKLEDISSKDLKLYLKRKAIKQNVSKMKIKKSKTHESKTLTMKFETEGSSETEVTDSDDDNKTIQESVANDTEKIPKLKLRMQEEDKSLSPERTRGKDTCISKIPFKRTRRTREEDARHSVKYDKSKTNENEIRRKYPQCMTGKIPKVIIKRTQIGTEFKCEISKSKKTLAIETSKWQPKVKLQRLQVLDHMVMDLKQSKTILKDKTMINAMSNTPLHIEDDINNKDSRHDNKVKLCRSNSASSLSPVKCKQRRLSDPDYMKVDTKLVTDFININSDDNKHKLLNINEVSNLKVVDSENKNLKRKSKKRLFSQSKKMSHSLNNESENETERPIKSKNTTENSFKNLLTNKDNDLVVEKKEYSSLGTKESTSCIEDKLLGSGIVRSRNFDDTENSIIKVDSSDESQTTIELLPASPDSSENESKNREFESTNRLYIKDAVPTQLELELELIDKNNIQRSDILVPKINELNSVNIEKCDHPSYSRRYINEESTKAYFSDLQYSSQNTFDQNKMQSLEKKSNDYFYCNDLLVKEVLAAKETLKKCLTRSVNENTEQRISRPKTVAEKKQGLSFNFKDLEKSYCKSETVQCSNNNENMKIYSKSKSTENEYKSIHRLNIVKVEEKHSKEDKLSYVEKRLKSNDLQDRVLYATECSTASTCGYTCVPKATTISLKATKQYGRITTVEESSNKAADSFYLSNKQSSVHAIEKFHEEISEKKTTSSIQNQRDNESTSETKIKEDNMPLLVPEFALNFDSSSDRDSSRSPPVITNQEEVENSAEDAKDMKSKVITPIEKVEEDEEHSYKDCEMTIADIITQLAYHEKATKKHRRYCNLCERWFPTTSRHRRHLAGYQHRYMELTQRKSIHTLFILFTGKPCPRLLPANVIRKDCSIGELTPLQIAVQDIAKYVEHTQQDCKPRE